MYQVYADSKAYMQYGAGSIPDQVRKLQKCLNRISKTGLVEDGSFGPATDRAVRAFHKKYGLTVDGSVGPKTRAKLNRLL